MEKDRVRWRVIRNAKRKRAATSMHHRASHEAVHGEVLHQEFTRLDDEISGPEVR
jgi:hypothetical protein